MIVSGSQGDQVFALKSAETPYRLLVEAMHDAALMLDLRGTILYCNHRLEAMVECPPDSVVGKPLTDFILPDQLANLRHLLTNIPPEGRSAEFCLRPQNTLARPVPVQLSVRPLISDGFEGLVAVVTDLTTQKAYEAILHRSKQELEEQVRARTAELDTQREWLRVTLSSIGDAVIAFDISSKVTFLNPVAARLTGWPEGEALGQSASQLLRIIQEHTRQPVEDMVSRVLEEKRTIVIGNHTTLLARDGSELPIEDSAAPILDASGQLTGVVVVFHEVTEKRRAHELLQRQAELLDCVSDAIVSTDTEFRISTWNKAAERIYGWTAQQAVGRNADELLKTRFLSITREQAAEQLHTNRSVEITCEHQDREGREILVQSNVRLLYNAAGHPAGTIGVLRDITERKRAEEVLRSQATLLDLAHDAILVRDTGDAITFWNRGAEVTYGWERREAMGRITHELLRTRFPKPLMELMAEVFELGHWEGELNHTRKDGQEVVVASRWALRRDAAGHPVGVLEINRDITERKRAEADLRLSEEKFRTLADNMSQFAWMADEKGWIFWYNRRWFDFTGTTLEEMQGWGWQKVHHPDHVQRVVARIQRSWDTGELWEDTFPLRGKDGRYRWFLSRALPIRDEAGKVKRWFGTNTDVTELREVQEALRESEQRLALALEGGQMGMWEWDLQTGQSVWNVKEYEVLGLPPSDGQPPADLFFQLVHPENRITLDKSLQEAFGSRRDWRHEFRIVRPDGQLRWLVGAGRATFAQDGKPQKMVGVNYDITERKAFQAELERLIAERTAKLQELVSELEHFSYSITHDMRAPLRAMQSFAELLAEAYSNGQQQEAQRFLERIRTAANRMDALIRDALSYSETIRKHLPLGPVDPSLLLRGMLDTYPELQGVQIEVQPDIPFVFANEGGLTQVFSNLLSNAIKFAKLGRPVEVRIWAELTSQCPGPAFDPLLQPESIRSAGFTPIPSFPGPDTGGQTQWVRIWVEDNGIGISEVMLSRVFNLFSRGSNERSGTGVGLALVRKVVDRMSGRVGVESTEGQGSRFWIELAPFKPL
ncbi:MAG: PAS domain S-box protein [Verrucomicrobiota bacterium]